MMRTLTDSEEDKDVEFPFYDGYYDPADLEFSETYGRDPNYPAGWWILSALAGTVLMIGGLAWAWWK